MQASERSRAEAAARRIKGLGHVRKVSCHLRRGTAYQWSCFIRTNRANVQQCGVNLRTPRYIIAACSTAKTE